MLITISGMVGSGKSTTAKHLVQLLDASGLKPRYRRFRSLSLFGLGRQTSRDRSDRGAEEATVGALRGSDFKLRRLTAPRAIGYAARIVAFRLSRVGGFGRCDVVDRYFYDNFIQYKLTSKLELLYAAALRRLIPTPDLALLVVATDETIYSRRSNYAREYVFTAGRRYEAIADLFPNLIRIRTDPGSSAQEEILQIVNAVIGRENGRLTHSKSPNRAGVEKPPPTPV
jgi:thymidylate kinase